MPKIYVEATPLPEAWARFSAELDLRPLAAEEVPAIRAAGRVTARLILARLSSPHYHASAMDGYAVKAETTYGASDRSPVTLRVAEGIGATAATTGPSAPAARAAPSAPALAVRVDTGDPVPPGFDAVVPLEDAIALSGPAGQTIELRSAVHPWQDVRAQGEDIVAGQVLFTENHLLGPVDVALLLAAGVAKVPVWRRPVVTFIPTGDEIVSPLPNVERGQDLALAPGQIVETNGTMVRLTLEAWGAEARLVPPVPDDPELIGRAVDLALAASDMVIIGAGSSAGRGDFTERIIAERGRVLVHGVATRPGKPVILGVVAASAPPPGEAAPPPGEGAEPGGAAQANAPVTAPTGPAAGTAAAKPVIGLPGYPVSSALALDLFVRPVVAAWLGQPVSTGETLKARLGRALPSPLGLDEFVRVTVGLVRDYVAVPLPRGAGVLSSLAQADGTIRVPANREGLEAGETVEVALYRPRRLIDRAILVTGSHDLLLDILASRLVARDPGLTLSAGRVGSLSGLLALRDGLAHMAGAHLLDEATGEYNRSWIRRVMPGRTVRLITLAWRQQGLVVPRGNPKGIRGLADLCRPGIVYINRQRGSGTRVLLDYLLRRDRLDASVITGYNREEGSHLGVASAVSSGAADAGLGILAAAKALGLDFVPVAEERYDLVYLPEFEDDPRFALLRAVLAGDDGFRRSALDLGGYDLRDTGTEETVEALETER